MPENDDVEFDELLSQLDDGTPLAKRLRNEIKSRDKRNRELEAALKSTQEQVERLATVERDAVLARAGVPAEGFGALFAKAYDGELTIDAVKTAWAALNGNVAEADKPDPATERRTAETAAADRMAGASSSPLDVSKEAAYDHELRSAKTKAEAIAVMSKYGKLAGAQD